MPMTPALEATGLTKRYRTKGAQDTGFLAVDHIDFEMHRGEVFGFLGPNGAGKTTTIRMCTGITRPTSGRVVISGSDLIADPIRAKERIGVVSDVAGLYTEMSAWDNLLFFASLHDLDARQAAVQAEHLLRLFGLYDARHRSVATFSTRMRKHLAIATALVQEPDILFLDEPTTGVDVQSARQLRAMIQELSQQGMTFF